MTEPYFAMTTPPPNAESKLLDYLTKQQRSLGLLSPITGLPVSLITEYSELSPSVKRVVDYLYEHDDCTLDVTGVQKIGGANLKQVDNPTGEKAVTEYQLAQSGKCTKPTITLDKK